MKTATINMNYESAHIQTVEITNDMAPLNIGISTNGQIEIQAELKIHSFVPGTDIAEYFDVNENGSTMTIELEDIPELHESFTEAGKSQIWIRIPKGIKVTAEAENLPIYADGLECELVLHNENGPLSINNCTGDKELENENGPIKVLDSIGDIRITLENGPLSAEGINGGSITVESENGPVKIRSASFQKVNITNENGVIYYESLPVENGEFDFENENGVVHLAIPEDMGFELDAESESGVIQCTLDVEITTDGDHKVLRRGDESTKISIRTENGVIKLSSEGQPNLQFLKLKMEELRKKIKSSVNAEDKEQVMKVLDTVMASVEKALGSISEIKVKESLSAAMDKLKAMVENLDVDSAKDKVVFTVEQVGDEVVSGLKSVLRKVKEHSGDELHQAREQLRREGEGLRKERIILHHEMDSLKDYINKVVESVIIQPGVSRGMNNREKQEVDERSRVKILEMLESGKITAEEAERLLKAIGKE